MKKIRRIHMHFYKRNISKIKRKNKNIKQSKIILKKIIERKYFNKISNNNSFLMSKMKMILKALESN